MGFSAIALCCPVVEWYRKRFFNAVNSVEITPSAVIVGLTILWRWGAGVHSRAAES